MRSEILATPSVPTNHLTFLSSPDSRHPAPGIHGIRDLAAPPTLQQIAKIGKQYAASGCEMKRRTFKRIRAENTSRHHHHVYVVLLSPAAAQIRRVRSDNPGRDPQKPCLYVGLTGLTPEERF